LSIAGEGGLERRLRKDHINSPLVILVAIKGGKEEFRRGGGRKGEGKRKRKGEE